MKRILLAGLLFLAAHSAGAQPKCGGTELFSNAACAGDDLNTQEKELIRLVNEYRAQNQLGPVPASPALSKLANRHLIDLEVNVRYLTHGWSNCPYDIKSQATWNCVFESPSRLATGYNGRGFENLYRNQGANATPALALEAWKKSPMHNALILNLDVWKDTKFDAFGVAIAGNYAALWFGTSGGRDIGATKQSGGLGLSFKEVVEGLTTVLSIQKESTVGGSEKWAGRSADKTIRLELYGSESEISETTMALSIKLLKNGQLTPQSRSALSKFLENVTEKWSDREKWLSGALEKLSATPKLSQTITVGSRSIELKSNPNGTLSVWVRPSKRPVAKEF